MSREDALATEDSEREVARAPRARRRIGWRGPVATVLIVVGCVLAPISVVAVWSANQVSNTTRYVENVSPLITEPAVRNALTDKISKAVSDQIDVQGLTKQVATELSARGLNKLSSLLSSFSGSIASGVNGFIHSAVAKIVVSPQVQRLWVQGNRLVHQQLVLALEGKKSAITVSHGQVVVGLAPIVDQVKRNLADRGLTIVNKLPPINPTFSLFSAKYLVQGPVALPAAEDGAMGPAVSRPHLPGGRHLCRPAASPGPYRRGTRPGSIDARARRGAGCRPGRST